MMRSRYRTWHPDHRVRRQKRTELFDLALPHLLRLWSLRGWVWYQPDPGHRQPSDDIRLRFGAENYHARIYAARGRVYLPGWPRPLVFRAHDPLQLQVLLDYAARRLAWLRARGLLPHQRRGSWCEHEGEPQPPWPPVERREVSGRLPRVRQHGHDAELQDRHRSRQVARR